MKTVLSSEFGMDSFRKYLVIEFAEEGLDLWKAVHDMLGTYRLKALGGGLAALVAFHNGGGGVVAGTGDASGGEFDIRKTGQELFLRFLKSGSGAECNLPGTVVKKVRGLEARVCVDVW